MKKSNKMWTRSEDIMLMNLKSSEARMSHLRVRQPRMRLVMLWIRYRM